MYHVLTYLAAGFNVDLMPKPIVHLHSTAHHYCSGTVSTLRYTHTQAATDNLHCDVVPTGAPLELCVVEEESGGVTGGKLEVQGSLASDVKRVKCTIAAFSLGPIETYNCQLTSFSVKVSTT